MKYIEFENLEEIKDKDNPFTNAYKLKDGSIFYVEPAFYTQLSNFKESYKEEDYKRIVDTMIKLASERKKVIYTYDFENPFTKKDGYIYLEFIDICDYLNIAIEDKSRGSDYGD